MSQRMAPQPVLGHVVTWSIGKVALNRRAFYHLVRVAGLDEELIPQAPRARSCLVKTLRDLTQEGFLRLAHEAPGHALYWVVVEDLQPESGAVSAHVESKFHFDKRRGHVTCEEPALQARVDALMAHYKRAFLPGDIRRFLVEVVKGSGALALRDRGGVYFIPATQRPLVEALERFIEALGSEASLILLSIPDTPHEAKNLERALKLELAQELSALGGDIESLAVSTGRVRTTTWLRRVSRVRALRAKVHAYTQLLRLAPDPFEGSLQHLEGRIREGLIG